MKVPDIRPIAPKPAELDVILMRFRTIPEHKNQFVARSIERSHAAVALDPDAQVEVIAAGRAAGAKHFRQVPPVHANIDQCTWRSMLTNAARADFKKVANSLSDISPVAIGNSR